MEPSRTLEQEEPQLPQQQPAEPPPPKRKSYWWVWVLVIAAVAAPVYYLRSKQDASKAGVASTSPAGRGGRGLMVTPVVAAKAHRGDINVYLAGLGTVTPIYTVTVKSRVDGQLMKVYYKEGDNVKEGDPLVDLDPRPFQVQLTQAEGQLIKDQSSLDNAKIDLARYQTLLTHNAVPEQTLATQKALVEQDQGTVKVDQGLIDSAKLNITYSHITAPISGRIGLRLVDPGNIVHASDSQGLLVITQVHPISVIFPLSEIQIPLALEKVRSGQRLKVLALDPSSKQLLAQGWLSTIDNQIDPTTGTLKMRALFNNEHDTLFPNQFVNVSLLVEQKTNRVVVPAAVIQRNSTMTYVWLVKPDSTVTVRPVTTGASEGDQTEIVSGLSAGDIVVMTGVDKLQEKSAVKMHLYGEKAPPEASPAPPHLLGGKAAKGN